MARDFSAFIEECVKDAEAIAKEAMVTAAKKARLELYKGALKKGLQEGYYGQYSPSIYKRSHSLKKAILPFYEDRSKGSNWSIAVGVEYDASRLKGLYHSNSKLHQSGDTWISRNSSGFSMSANNGIPDSNWIMENFMLGVHPRTTANHQYAPVNTGITQESIMNVLLDEQLDKISDYVNDALMTAILSRW